MFAIALRKHNPKQIQAYWAAVFGMNLLATLLAFVPNSAHFFPYNGLAGGHRQPKPVAA